MSSEASQEAIEHAQQQQRAVRWGAAGDKGFSYNDLTKQPAPFTTLRITLCAA